MVLTVNSVIFALISDLYDFSVSCIFFYIWAVCVSRFILTLSCSMSVRLHPVWAFSSIFFFRGILFVLMLFSPSIAFRLFEVGANTDYQIRIRLHEYVFFVHLESTTVCVNFAGCTFTEIIFCTEDPETPSQSDLDELSVQLIVLTAAHYYCP